MIPSLISTTGTQSTYSDASTLGPINPGSSRAISFHQESLRHPGEASGSFASNATSFIPPPNGRRWVGDPEASHMSVSGYPDAHPSTPSSGPQFPTCGYLPWQQFSIAAARPYCAKSFVSGATPSVLIRPPSVLTRPPSSVPLPSDDMAFALTDRYIGQAPMSTPMYWTTSTPKQSVGIPQGMAASRRSSDEGTVNPAFLHLAPPAYRSPGMCFHGQEQPQLQHSYACAATAGALGLGIGMQVTPPSACMYDPSQHTSTSSATPMSTNLDQPVKCDNYSTAPSTDVPKRPEKKYACPHCDDAFARPFNRDVHNVEGYTRQHELNKHYKEKHPGVEPYKWKNVTAKCGHPGE
ncbi:hypothetical protein L226DRAFT_49685 [Lentinus tigrinus ALCF2SS1-7]|uniref:uncharacterized protein n=1 Tax=Lentinus tigrinus ALCF2SS1-7 TaxID=1328758 RepID=UPI0011660CDE|nr:hypothetical protein L226DRAFT_49685 [Lentinus tigrinus ALCF2SS1-7]